MGKLHQTLAVEPQKNNLFKKVIEEGVKTFSGRENLFKGVLTSTASRVGKEDPLYEDYKDETATVPVAETVPSKLEYIFDIAADYFDAVAQKDEANTRAKADVIVDGKRILTGVPAVTLLFLENKFKVVRNLLESVKTLDQARIWTPRKDQDDVYESNAGSKTVKRNTEEYITVAQATDKHPAQTAKVVRETVMAVRTVTDLCGLISVQRKSDLLARCDKIIEACKKARQTANDIEITSVNIGKSLFDCLMEQ